MPRGVKAYPWLKWLKKKKLYLKRGKDFEALPHSMAQQLRNAAFRYGYVVSVKVGENSIEATSRKVED